MKYKRMPIEIESPEQMGYDKIKYNLTESSFTDTKIGNLDLNFKDLLLCYGDHRGKPELRALIAKDAGVDVDDVLLTPGAAGGLFIISTSLLEKGDRIVVEHPNYATNLETPRALGAEIDFLKVKFEEGYLPSVAGIEKLLTPQTKLVSLTFPHNPTGTTLPKDKFERLIKDITSLPHFKSAKLLVDETYRDMGFERRLPVAAGLTEKAISVCSFSKSYGIPGIRLGWIICRDKAMMETFLAAKEQILICGSVVDEEIGYRFMASKDKVLGEVEVSLKEKMNILKTWYSAQKDFEWVEPLAGACCFPRIKNELKVDVEKFYKILNEKYGTFVGPGHWFEMDRRNFRIGFGWPTPDELREGLKGLSLAIQEARLN